MFNRKLCSFLIIALLTANTVFAEDKQAKTDLRELFQNNSAIIYGINMRTFNANDINGNDIIDFDEGETSGTFLNAIDRLDELKELGINAIHVLPITPVGKVKALGTAGSLYALSDFRTLNIQLVDEKSELSPREQAKKFIDECHKRDIRVIIDLPSCGSYDLYLNRPELFIRDEEGHSTVPVDWVDVRMFKVADDETLFHSDIFIYHKIFVDNIISMGADGIRADVASMKPYIFWKELIKYARSKKEGFLFLAEVSEKWGKPVSDNAYFTDYKKLLDAGFDGYYGDYFDLKNWKKMRNLTDSVKNREKTLNKYPEKKSVIGSFETHDEISPLLIGGEIFSKIIIWLNTTLPLNPYYIDGFLQADDYSYEYSNKHANETFTDDEYYYVHRGQIDIFNFSRKPGSNSKELINEHKQAVNFRNANRNVITQGKFIPLKTNNESVFAFQRLLKGKSIGVIINRNLVNSENVTVKIQKLNKKASLTFEKSASDGKLVKSTFLANLKPGEIIIFSIK